jgi:hypothetical protein
MNKPPSHIPKESLAARHVLKALQPYTVEHGGPLKVKEVSAGSVLPL